MLRGEAGVGAAVEWQRQQRLLLLLRQAGRQAGQVALLLHSQQLHGARRQAVPRLQLLQQQAGAGGGRGASEGVVA